VVKAEVAGEFVASTTEIIGHRGGRRLAEVLVKEIGLPQRRSERSRVNLTCPEIEEGHHTNERAVKTK